MEVGQISDLSGQMGYPVLVEVQFFEANQDPYGLGDQVKPVIVQSEHLERLQPMKVFWQAAQIVSR